MPWPSNPVRIRGTDYPSQKAAAQALGVGQNTITDALDGGWIDEVGLRKGGQRPKPCTYRGKQYPLQNRCGVGVWRFGAEGFGCRDWPVNASGHADGAGLVTPSPQRQASR